MSFDPISPQTFQPQMIQNNSLRLVQGGSALDKPSFGEKFMLGLKKFGAVFGRIGASVLRFFPGLGTVASAGLYGISNLAQYSYEKQVGKRMGELQQDEAMAQMNFQALTPGFGMFSGPSAPDVNDGLGYEKLGVVLNREVAARNEIEQFSVAS